ncbi:hypothetical protein BH09PAT4_BH09PAT4_03040 [soil metagenome]
MSKSEVSFFKAPRYLLRKHNILRFLRGHSGIKTVLDVGCGAGELACTLAQMGYTTTALDFSEDAIKMANSIKRDRKIKDTRLNFKLGGLEKVQGQKFDLVMCFEVLEHIENDQDLLKELINFTNKYVLISVPAKQKLFDESDKAVGHFRRYEKKELQAMLDESGLRTLRFANYGFPYTGVIRVARRAMFAKKLRSNAGESMEIKSKESGINPIKAPGRLHRLNIEPVMKILLYTSLPFNRTNLSDSYLALCEQTTKK